MPLPFDMATGYDSGGRAFPKPAITRGFSYKLPDRIEDLKLAVHVTYWDYSSVSKSVEPLAAARLAYVSKVIRGLNGLSSKTDVFIHTNAVRLTLEGTFALVHHDMSDQDGYSLSWKSRDLMLSSYKEYDAIMYMEDDILFQDNNLAYWHTNHSRCSKAGYYLGFVRTETDGEKLYCTDIAPLFGPCQPLRHSVVLEGEALYVNDVNLYSGLWILDRDEFEWFTTHPYFDLNECPFFYPYKRETSAVGAIPMFKGSLIAADFKNSLVPHIPNNYIGSEKYCKVAPNEVFGKEDSRSEWVTTLQSYVSQCEDVTVVGFSRSNVTESLIACKPKKITVFGNEPKNLDGFCSRATGLGVCFNIVLENSLITNRLLDTDMIVLNTDRSYKRIKMDIKAHGNKAKKYIVITGTSDFAAKNECDTTYPCNECTWFLRDYYSKLEDKAGISEAVLEFLNDNVHWSVAVINSDYGGLTILKRDDGSRLSGRLGIFYTNNNSSYVIKTLDNLKSIVESKPNFDIIVCSQENLPYCSFPVVPSLLKESSWVNLAVQILQALYKGREVFKYKYVSFLEHDVMYPPDYFDYSDFDTDILHNVNYRGVCEYGYQYFGGQFPVLSQMTVKLEYAIDHFEKFLLERVAGITHRDLELSGSATKRLTGAPAIHINRDSFTGHGNYFTINYLDQEIPYWGHYSNLWTV